MSTASASTIERSHSRRSTVRSSRSTGLNTTSGIYGVEAESSVATRRRSRFDPTSPAFKRPGYHRSVATRRKIGGQFHENTPRLYAGLVAGRHGARGLHHGDRFGNLHHGAGERALAQGAGRHAGELARRQHQAAVRPER